MARKAEATLWMLAKIEERAVMKRVVWASRSFARSRGTVGLKSSSCPSARVFAPRFLQVPSHHDTLALH